MRFIIIVVALALSAVLVACAPATPVGKAFNKPTHSIQAEKTIHKAPR